MKKQLRKKKTKWDAEALPTQCGNKSQSVQMMEKFNYATEDGVLPTVKIRIYKKLVMEIKRMNEEKFRSKKTEMKQEQESRKPMKIWIILLTK